MKYVLNSYYILRHDICRTFILGGRNGRVANGIAVDKYWKSIIHPAYAMMLSFFSSPIELNDAVIQISNFFNISEGKIMKFIKQMIDAKECWHTTLSGMDSGFPINLIIPEQAQLNELNYYSPEDFQFKKLDANTRRMIKSPLSIVWMPNNNCYTACEYCYADRKHHKSIFSYEKIEAFINDAKRSGVIEIMLTGGDFFENKHWKKILYLLKHNGYNIDMISTKKPLSNNELIDLKENGVRLQVSLDTLCDQVVARLLNVNSDYITRLTETLRMANELRIDFQVATVLTNLNDDIDNLNRLYSFISTLDYIRHWEVRVAFRSLYSKSDFNSLRSTRNQIEIVSNWIDTMTKQSQLPILWSPDDDDKYKKSKGGSRYFEGPVCAANMTNMIVLPDGNVTICEQLYWNPKFIIGNVFSESIESIWNSRKALNIWHKGQATIQSDSPCRKCKDFNDCFRNGNRCFANIIKAYGIDNSDFPDPRCHLAPEFKNCITHE